MKEKTPQVPPPLHDQSFLFQQDLPGSGIRARTGLDSKPDLVTYMLWDYGQVALEASVFPFFQWFQDLSRTTRIRIKHLLLYGMHLAKYPNSINTGFLFHISSPHLKLNLKGKGKPQEGQHRGSHMRPCTDHSLLSSPLSSIGGSWPTLHSAPNCKLPVFLREVFSNPEMSLGVQLRNLILLRCNLHTCG